MNIPISDSELAAENQRVDSEVAEANVLRAQGKDASSPDDPPQILFSRVLELCAFSNPRRKVVDGRSTILLDFAWNPSVKPLNANEALLQFFSGTLGIDEEDHAVQHLEGRFLADVTLDGEAIKIRKGTKVTIISRRADTGIWLLSRLDAWGEGRYFSFAIDGAGHIFAGKYRKFRATPRILPDSTEVSTDPPAPSTFRQSQLSVATDARAQSPAEDQSLAQQTQVRGYWIDPSTGLMWAARDNGKDVNWHTAKKYCHDLRLAGFSDWRLATIDELQGIYDDSRYTSLPPRKGIEYILAGRAKGGLSLTGTYHWSTSRVDGEHRNPGGNVWEFDFPSGKRHNDPPGYSGQIRALCVRGSEK